MGLQVKKNKQNEYSLTSSVSNESHHPDKKWISEAEAKKLLINSAFWKFVEKVIEIDMEFPNGYHVNDKRHMDENGFKFGEWWLKAAKSDNFDETIQKKFEEVYERLGLDFKI